ncbi:MAG: BlaI/MecI/CopY family transcriptional regulator [Acidobacteriota bacterium]|nr:MAG: BlaI/MecI/CopY family transcriptional regulator [Acidobacteriota bacterium]
MQLSEAEWKLMNALWDEAPASVREVHEAVCDETGWAYSTVKTMLTRLAEKGAVEVEMRGNAGWYTPRISRQEARRSALRGLLDRAFGGTFGSLIHHLIDDEKLTKKDRETLRELLEKEHPR